MVARRTWLFGLLAGVAIGVNSAGADDAAKPAPAKTSPPATDVPPDDSFFEFLGSVDSGDADWIDYLAHTDIPAVAKATPPGSKPEVKKDE
jgi:hypothetical protein